MLLLFKPIQILLHSHLVVAPLYHAVKFPFKHIHTETPNTIHNIQM